MSRITWPFMGYLSGAIIGSASIVAFLCVMQQRLEPGVLGLLIGCMAVAVGLALIRLFRGPIEPLSPIALIAYCQILIFVARPAYAIAYQDSRNIFDLNPYDTSMVTAQIYAGLGFMALCLGYVLKRREANPKPERKEVLPFSDSAWRRLSVPLYVVIAIGFLLYAQYIRQIGWSGYVSATLSGRSDELRTALNSNSGYFYSGLQFAIGALILVVFQAALRREKIKTFFLVLLLIISVFPQIASGSRSVFIPVAVALLIVLHTVRPSVLRPSRVLLWGPIAFVLGFVAPRIWRDNLAVGGSLLESIRVAVEPENLFDNFFGGLDTAMVDSYALQVAAQQRGDIDYHLGSTYLGLFSSVIPRALWSEKPVSIDEMLNSILFPATHAKSIGFAFGVYSEPTLNFGVLGVVVISLGLGVAIAMLANRSSESGHIASAFLSLMIASYIFPIMRGSLSFDSQRLLIALMPVLIVLVFFYRHSDDVKGQDAEYFYNSSLRNRRPSGMRESSPERKFSSS